MSRRPDKIIEYRNDHDLIGTVIPINKKTRKANVREKMSISAVLELIEKKRKSLK